MRRFASFGMLCLRRDQFQHLGLQRVWRDRQVLQTFGFGITGQVVEHLGGIASKLRIAGKKAEIGVNRCRDRVVVARAVVGIGHQPVALAPHDDGNLGVGFPVEKPIDNMRACAFQPPGLADIGGLVKARFQLNERCDGLPVFRRLTERGNDG